MTANTRETRTEFIARRTAEIAAEFRASFPDIAAETIDMMAAMQADTDWRRTRVYASPAKVLQSDRVWVGDGYTDGAEINFNPDGPMVSVTKLTYAEAAELRDELAALLERAGYDA